MEPTLARPFPEVPFGTLTLDEEKRLSADIDALLGFRVAPIEDSLSRQGSRAPALRGSGWKQELWLGLAIQNLQTPYSELRRWIEFLDPAAGDHWVDLGCAYGRLAFVLSQMKPGVRFTGFEFVGERLTEAKRVASLRRLKDARFEHQDLCAAGFAPPAADVYFIYDFGAPPSIEKILGDLYAVSAERTFALIARGDRIRGAIDRGHPWLSPVPARVSEKAVLYRVTGVPEQPK